MEENKTNTQQPEVIACQGGRGISPDGIGKPNKNLPAEINDADIPLIRRYNDFSHKCVLEGMRNIKEIAELFRVKEELGLA